MALQRTFSGFPTGYPGLALLFLRLVVGGTASSQAWLLITASHGVVNTGVVVALLAFVTGLALVIGFMTPIASVLLSAVGLLLTVDSSIPGHLPLFESGLARLEFHCDLGSFDFPGSGRLLTGCASVWAPRNRSGRGWLVNAAVRGNPARQLERAPSSVGFVSLTNTQTS